MIRWIDTDGNGTHMDVDGGLPLGWYTVRQASTVGGTMTVVGPHPDAATAAAEHLESGHRTDKIVRLEAGTLASTVIRHAPVPVTIMSKADSTPEPTLEDRMEKWGWSQESRDLMPEPSDVADYSQVVRYDAVFVDPSTATHR